MPNDHTRPAETAVARELAATSIFTGVPLELLETLARAAFPRRYGRGQVVFVEGEPSDRLYLVRAGRVKIATTSAHGDELLLTVLGAGDVLGEVSLLDGGPRSAGAEALERSELLAIPVAAAREVLLAHPAALLRITIELASTVRRLTGTAADLVFLDLPRRLAKLIAAGDGAAGSLNQSELAAMLGAGRQSVNKALSRLQERGWISLDSGSITVHDVPALRRFAGS